MIRILPLRRWTYTLALLTTLSTTLLGFASHAHADRWVDVAGSDAGNDCSVDLTPCQTIQHAIGQAAATEVIFVGAGTYAESPLIDKALTLRGAQAGVPVASRTAGGAGETIIDARGLADYGIFVNSPDVIVEGFDVLGDATNYVGILASNASGDLPNVTIRDNFVHGMAELDPNTTIVNMAYGVQVITGAPAARFQVYNLTLTGNEVYDIGATGTVAGAGLFVANVIGVSPGLGATISGNSVHDLATRGLPPDAGTGIIVVNGADNVSGIPILPCSGVAVSGNTYADAIAGLAIQADASSVTEASTSFTNVNAIVVNLDRLSTIDELALGRYSKSDKITPTYGYLPVFGVNYAYFSTIQGSITASSAGATINVSAGVFTESVIVDRDVDVLGAKAGLDGRTRDTSSGETILTLPLLVRGNGVTLDGLLWPHPGTVAVHVDTAVANVTLRNLVLSGATRGIFLERALTAFVNQNLLQNFTTAAIDAGTDNGTGTPSDDVLPVAVIENNEIANSKFGVTGYMKFSTIQNNEIRDYAGASSAGVSGQLQNTMVANNTLDGYPAGSGIRLASAPNRPLTASSTFRCNDIGGNLFGFEAHSTQTQLSTIVASNNNISGNSVGMVNSAAQSLAGYSNYWGCPGGPGAVGCDSAIGNIVTAPFLTAASNCSNCFSDGECDDGVICNGEEECNTLINLCVPGDPPDCNAEGPQASCNTGSCVEGTGCVLDPLPDGTLCNDGAACSEADECLQGVCLPGGNGDSDDDGICDLDDNCPVAANANQSDADGDGVGDVCDSGDLGLAVSRLTFNVPPGSNNDRARFVAIFQTDPFGPDAFNVDAPVRMRITTPNQGVILNHTFQAAQCKAGARGGAACKSPDKRHKIKFRENRRHPGEIQARGQGRLQNLPPQIQGPISVVVVYGNGITRVDTLDECVMQVGTILCRDL